MVKPKEKDKPERRTPGPKNKRPAIPTSFQISRQVSPMRHILDEAEGKLTNTTNLAVNNAPPVSIDDGAEDEKIITSTLESNLTHPNPSQPIPI